MSYHSTGQWSGCFFFSIQSMLKIEAKIPTLCFNKTLTSVWMHIDVTPLVLYDMHTKKDFPTMGLFLADAFISIIKD